MSDITEEQRLGDTKEIISRGKHKPSSTHEDYLGEAIKKEVDKLQKGPKPTATQQEVL